MIPNTIPSRLSERGATLILSLMILMILTLVGVSAMQNSTLQEKISGNLRDKAFSFQVAESVLGEGEDWIEEQNTAPAADNDCTITEEIEACEVFIIGSSDPDDPFDARSDKARLSSLDFSEILASLGLSDISEAPKFFTEEVENFGDDMVENRDQLGLGHTGEGAESEKVVYRVTARSTGNTAGAISQIQTYYKRRF